MDEPEMTDEELDGYFRRIDVEIDAYLERTGGTEARLREVYRRVGRTHDQHGRPFGDQERPAATSAETKIQP